MDKTESTQVERALLGAMMVGGFDECADIVSEASFGALEHRELYRQISDIAMAGRTPDAVTVADESGRSAADLARMCMEAPATANARQYAERVRDRAVRRHLVEAAHEIVRAATSGSGGADELLADARAAVDRVDAGGAARFLRFRDLMPEASSWVEQRSKGGEQGITTGLHDLDNITGGIESTDLVILAGRPSMGKTAIALQIAMNMGQTMPGLFFSMEMSALQCTLRALSSDGGIHHDRLRSGKMGDGDWPQLTKSMARLSSHHLLIDESPGLSVDQLRSRVKRAKKEHGIKYAIVDYLQLMDHGNKDNLTQAIGDTTRAAKRLCMEEKIPIIFLSQLSRQVEQRRIKRPQLSDLRDSGAIEQDADIIMMLYREDYYEEGKNPGMLEVSVAKNRNGRIGKAVVNFHLSTQRVTSLAAGQDWVDSPPYEVGGFDA